ncbi:hypothetical protein RYH80_16945 [Halobaculum sp. MBLA0147]|uniref:hypothetical protein n=1 Tax=Halobaculum sp. MBLA0147 TaxID=3079934 RepID=UPI00352475D9
MTVSVRILDDGAWLSVDDDRTVGVGGLWRLGGFCDCATADFVLEGFTRVGVTGRTVEVRAYGTCIQCDESATTDWLPVGRIVADPDPDASVDRRDGETDEPNSHTPESRVFREVAPDAPASGLGSRRPGK